MIEFGKVITCTRCGRKEFANQEANVTTSYTAFEIREMPSNSNYGAIINEVELCSTCYGEFVDFILNKEKKEKKNEKKKDQTSKNCVNCTYSEDTFGYLQCYAQKDAPKIMNPKNTCEHYKEDEE